MAGTGRWRAAVSIAGAVLVGILTALQARMNGALGVALDDGFVAAVISFGSGFVILVVLSLALPVGRRGFGALVAGIRERRIPLWMLFGGAAGALSVATQGLAVGIIGVALFTVGVVAGQTLCGLLLDRIGFGPSGYVAVTPGRVVGAALALVAVGISLTGGGLERVPLWMLLLPVATGIGIAWQQGTNGRLRQRVGSPLTATLVNFAGGTFFLAIAALIHVALVGPPEALPTNPLLYFGGAAGVIYIFLSAALVVYTGVLLLGLASIAGQLVSSVVLDRVFPAPAAPSLWISVIMLAVALASVIIAVSPWRRR